MLTLNDGRSELWQWDTGRTLAVDADCSQVHFSNKVFGRSIDVDVADGVATIPDVLLQTDNDLNVWAFVGTAENGYTKISKTFKVNRRNKPADYVFTPVDQTTIAEIAATAQSVRDDADAGLFNGKPGENGRDGVDGKDGAPGKDGKPGVDGISATHSWNGTVLTITSASGTSSADLKGEKGDNGGKGDTGPAGEAGGFYIPAVTQPDANTIRMSFTPSKEDMPSVEPADITLPAGGGGLTTAQVKALDGMFKVCAFIKADVSEEYNAFRTAFDIEAATITGISATYSGGNVTAGTSVDELTGIVVTANYSDGSKQTVTGYTLSGTIAEGSNTITVTYEGMTTTFTVTGVAEEVTLTSISATYSGGSVPAGTALDGLTGIVVTAHYSDGTSTTVTGYTLSGTIAEGENTVTVSYGGKTATFTVTGVAESGGDGETVLDLTWTAGLISEAMNDGSSTGYTLNITNSDAWKYSFPVPVDKNTKLIFSTSGPLRQARVFYLNANVTEGLVGSETIKKTETFYISGTNASYPSPKELSIPEDAVYFMVNAQRAAIDNNEFTIELV